MHSFYNRQALCYITAELLLDNLAVVLVSESFRASTSVSENIQSEAAYVKIFAHLGSMLDGLGKVRQAFRIYV